MHKVQLILKHFPARLLDMLTLYHNLRALGSLAVPTGCVNRSDYMCWIAFPHYYNNQVTSVVSKSLKITLRGTSIQTVLIDLKVNQ